MGDAAISFVVDHLGKLLLDEVGLQRGLPSKVEWLKGELLWMESFLEDAKSKGEGGNRLIKAWVKDLVKIAYLAEDVIDNHMLLQMKWSQLLVDDGGFFRSVKRYLICLPSCSQILKERRTFSNEIQDLERKIGDIRTRRETYGLVQDITTRREMNNSVTEEDEEAMQTRRRVSPRLTDDVVIVGFDAHETEMVERLVDVDEDEHSKRRAVFSIVGAGGIGKSTLAKRVYNNTLITSHFDARCWASVSQDFNPILLLKEIIEKVSGSRNEVDGEIALMEKLHDHLKDKKYLIVLDDIWSEDVWDRVRGAFPDTNNGSRVLITTRSRQVATLAGSPTQTPIFELPCLDDQQSWNLFTANVFVKENNEDARTRGDGSCPAELEPIAQQLVRRCGGLPLALVVLARLLLSKQDMNPISWKRFADKMEWSDTRDGMRCMNILGLSYKHLRHRHLRSCFLYLGCFPEDEEIKSTMVTRLWIAEGFIPEKHNQTIEETAEEYLEELAQRSMIQVVEKKTDGGVKTFKIHDLFHEMCLREAAKDGFLGVAGACEDYELVRRLAIHYELTEETGKWLITRLNLRSLLVFNKVTKATFFLDGLGDQRLLRVLYFDKHDEDYLSAKFAGAIKSMVYLRYLGFGAVGLTSIQSSIGNLQNLLTLDLQSTKVRQLPDSIGKLKMLRHLLVPWDCACPPTICFLTNLQTLTFLGAQGGWIEEHSVEKLFKLRIVEISDISNNQQEEALLRSINKLEHLSHFYVRRRGEEVTLSTDFITVFSNSTSICKLELRGPLSRKQLPTSHEFPANLGQLVLAFSRLEEDPMPILGMLPNLTFLELHQNAHVGKEMVCCENGFPQLQHLEMSLLGDLEQWTVQVGAMPKLQSLEVYRCHKLVMLPEGLQHVTSLRHLEVIDHRDEFRDRLREDDGLDWHKIKHVQNIYIGRF